MQQVVKFLSSPASLAALDQCSNGRTAVVAGRGEMDSYRYHSGNFRELRQIANIDYIAVFPDCDPQGMQGVWLREPEAPETFEIDWAHPAANGARYDAVRDMGATSDAEKIGNAIALIGELRAHGIRYTTLRFTPQATYFLDALPQEGYALNFSDLTVDGRSAKLVFRKLQRNVGLFQIGNNRWAAGRDETLTENIRITNFVVDFVQNGAFLRFIRLRYPCRKVEVDHCDIFQSLHGDATPHQHGKGYSGDCWFIDQSCIHDRRSASYANPMARLHDLHIHHNKVRNRIQCTAGAGVGINGAVYEYNIVDMPRANGFAIGAIGISCRIENIRWAGNKVTGYEGRAILCSPDILTQRKMMSPGTGDLRSYIRNIVIEDNEFVASGESRQAVYLAGGVQGLHNVRLSRNRIDASAGGTAITIRTGDNDPFGWAKNYHGGKDPVIAADAFDSRTSQIVLPRHQLQHAAGLCITPVSDNAVMPKGLCADIPYFVGLAGDDRFELYERFDPATNRLSGKVSLGPGARGQFMIECLPISCNVTIDDSNQCSGGSLLAYLTSIRDSSFSFRSDGRSIYAGKLADVVIAPEMPPVTGGSRIVFNEGGTLRVEVVLNMEVIANQFAANPAIISTAFGNRSNYDVTISGQATITYSRGNRFPKMLIDEQVPSNPAFRKGPGWKAPGFRLSASGTDRQPLQIASPKAARNALPFR